LQLPYCLRSGWIRQTEKEERGGGGVFGAVKIESGAGKPREVLDCFCGQEFELKEILGGRSRDREHFVGGPVSKRIEGADRRFRPVSVSRTLLGSRGHPGHGFQGLWRSGRSIFGTLGTAQNRFSSIFQVPNEIELR
jgi:hypothetical protein